MSKYKYKKKIDIKDKSLGHIEPNACVFCNLKINNEETYGKTLKKCGLVVHYFCMLFSSGLGQNGKSQDQGIFGFLPEDIIKEVRRGIRLRCSFCKGKGATIGCVVGSCRKVFHFGCGQKNGTLHQYFDTYSSYCEDHRPRQMIPIDRMSFSGKTNTVCPICITAVTPRPANDTLKAPCCRNSWFHRQCIQKHATTSGLYFFKCPLCNNKEIFQDEMLQYGIYIPDQDAAWEREPHAYDDLQERYMKCDAMLCRCTNGREYNKDGGKWQILVCDWCGSKGTHVGCHGLLKTGKDYICTECKELDIKYRKEHKLGKTKKSGNKFKSSYGSDTKTPENTKMLEEKFKRKFPTFEGNASGKRHSATSGCENPYNSRSPLSGASTSFGWSDSSMSFSPGTVLRLSNIDIDEEVNVVDSEGEIGNSFVSTVSTDQSKLANAGCLYCLCRDRKTKGKEPHKRIRGSLGTSVRQSLRVSSTTTSFKGVTDLKNVEDKVQECLEPKSIGLKNSLDSNVEISCDSSQSTESRCTDDGENNKLAMVQNPQQSKLKTSIKKKSNNQMIGYVRRRKQRRKLPLCNTKRERRERRNMYEWSRSFQKQKRNDGGYFGSADSSAEGLETNKDLSYLDSSPVSFSSSGTSAQSSSAATYSGICCHCKKQMTETAKTPDSEVPHETSSKMKNYSLSKINKNKTFQKGSRLNLRSKTEEKYESSFDSLLGDEETNTVEQTVASNNESDTSMHVLSHNSINQGRKVLTLRAANGRYKRVTEYRRRKMEIERSSKAGVVPSEENCDVSGSESKAKNSIYVEISQNGKSERKIREFYDPFEQEETSEEADSYEWQEIDSCTHQSSECASEIEESIIVQIVDSRKTKEQKCPGTFVGVQSNGEILTVADQSLSIDSEEETTAEVVECSEPATQKEFGSKDDSGSTRITRNGRKTKWQFESDEDRQDGTSATDACNYSQYSWSSLPEVEYSTDVQHNICTPSADEEIEESLIHKRVKRQRLQSESGNFTEEYKEGVRLPPYGCNRKYFADDVSMQVTGSLGFSPAKPKTDKQQPRPKTGNVKERKKNLKYYYGNKVLNETFNTRKDYIDGSNKIHGNDKSSAVNELEQTVKDCNRLRSAEDKSRFVLTGTGSKINRYYNSTRNRYRLMSEEERTKYKNYIKAYKRNPWSHAKKRRCKLRAKKLKMAARRSEEKVEGLKDISDDSTNVVMDDGSMQDANENLKNFVGYENEVTNMEETTESSGDLFNGHMQAKESELCHIMGNVNNDKVMSSPLKGDNSSQHKSENYFSDDSADYSSADEDGQKKRSLTVKWKNKKFVVYTLP